MVYIDTHIVHDTLMKRLITVVNLIMKEDPDICLFIKKPGYQGRFKSEQRKKKRNRINITLRKICPWYASARIQCKKNWRIK